MEKYRQELEENGIPQKSLTSIEQYAKHWFSLRNGNHNSPRTAERERLDIRHIRVIGKNVLLVLSPNHV